MLGGRYLPLSKIVPKFRLCALQFLLDKVTFGLFDCAGIWQGSKNGRLQYMDIDCHPKIPYLVSQKEQLTPKEDLNYPARTTAL
jgi:hypothetical protein